MRQPKPSADSDLASAPQGLTVEIDARDPAIQQDGDMLPHAGFQDIGELAV
jgi:hypothetical protein